MGFLVPIGLGIASAVGAAGSAVAGGIGAVGSAVGGGLSALGGLAGGASAGSILGGLSVASSLASTGLGIAGALNPPKPPAPLMAPPVMAVPNPPKNNNTSFAALAAPSGQTNFGAPNTGKVKTLLGQ